MGKKFDFCGWATRNNTKCSDGLTIMKDAFKDCDGLTVPLCWGHNHDDPSRVLGHALLENREDGVYTYCKFNDTEQGQNAKLLVEHGDVTALSIYANKLKKQGNFVMHGAIREVSLVLAGANPGAYIETVLAHGEEVEGEAIIYTGEELSLMHSDEHTDDIVEPEQEPENNSEAEIQHADGAGTESSKTIKEVYEDMTEEQKIAVHAMVGLALESDDDESDEMEQSDIEHADMGGNNEGGKEMKNNIFDNDDRTQNDVLSHADQEAIISLAKSRSVGTLQDAIGAYLEEKKDTLAHGIDGIESLFPDYRDVYPGAPEKVTRDMGWVGTVMQKTSKSPISRIRTRQADVRGEDLQALGYKKGDKKALSANIKLMSRTTDPQSIYIKDALHRDDIIDITDFDVVSYQYDTMRMLLNEEVAKAILIGDGREEGDAHKIDESHIRSIWHDDELYTIHADVDIAAAKAELQGTNTGANFGDNYIYAEAIITAALYAREKYKGSGNLDFFCTPHLLNVMLLARDLNGRRIYDSKADLAAALNVRSIQTVEQFEGKIRTDALSKKHKLLGLFVNLADYRIGSTKGGEITKFQQFDIDFNQEKYLIETRISGALTKIFSAIALEEPVADSTVSQG